MIEDKSTLDKISIYENKILAQRAELALLRTKRTGTINDKDKYIFNILKDLLVCASEGDIAISSSNFSISNDKSLEILKEALAAIASTLNTTESFNNKLKLLMSSAESLAKGDNISGHEFNSLLLFVKKYGLVQEGMLRKFSTPSSDMANEWLPIKQLGYSFIP